MTSEKFIEKARQLLHDNFYPTTENYNLVWFSKTLEHKKALFYSPDTPTRYYEVTENGHLAEIYIDSYAQINNVCVDMLKEKENNEQ